MVATTWLRSRAARWRGASTLAAAALVLSGCNLETQWAPELLEVEFRVQSDADLAAVAESGVWASMLRSLDDDPAIGPSSDRGDLSGPWEAPEPVASPEHVQAGGNVSARLWSDVPYRVDLIPAGVACGVIEDARDVVDAGVTLVLAMDGDRLTCTVE